MIATHGQGLGIGQRHLKLGGQFIHAHANNSFARNAEIQWPLICGWLSIVSIPSRVFNESFLSRWDSTLILTKRT
jgi:hypothetical protein